MKIMHLSLPPHRESILHILFASCTPCSKAEIITPSFINLNKGFSPNTVVDDKVEVCLILDIMTESLSDEYLGLPSMIGVDRVDCLKRLIERIQKIINGWKGRTLSYGGKEALIKPVAQAIPA